MFQNNCTAVSQTNVGGGTIQCHLIKMAVLHFTQSRPEIYLGYS